MPPLRSDPRVGCVIFRSGSDGCARRRATKLAKSNQRSEKMFVFRSVCSPKGASRNPEHIGHRVVPRLSELRRYRQRTKLAPEVPPQSRAHDRLRPETLDERPALKRIRRNEPLDTCGTLRARLPADDFDDGSPSRPPRPRLGQGVRGNFPVDVSAERIDPDDHDGVCVDRRHRPRASRHRGLRGGVLRWGIGDGCRGLRFWCRGDWRRGLRCLVRARFLPIVALEQPVSQGTRERVVGLVRKHVVEHFQRSILMTLRRVDLGESDRRHRWLRHWWLGETRIASNQLRGFGHVQSDLHRARH